MLTKFLCPTHRQWVYLYPLEALAQIQAAKTQGEALRVQQRWSEALPYIGSALEMTAIIMDINRARCVRYGLLYTTLAIAVADTQSRLSESAVATATLKSSEAWLRSLCLQMRDDKLVSDSLLDCLDTLRQGVEFFREISQLKTHKQVATILH